MRLMFPLSLLNPEGEVGGPRGEGGSLVVGATSARWAGGGHL